MLSAQELNECWPDIVSGFPVLTNETVIPQPCDDETFLNIRTMIIEKDLSIIVSANVMHRILNNINFNIKNSFWLHFLNEEIVDLNILRNALEYLTTDISGFEKFRIAIDGFFQLIHSYVPTIKRVQMLHENEMDLFKHYYSRIRFLLESQLPIKYKTIVYHFYRTSLRIMYFRAHTHYFNADSTLCPGCYYERTCCSCEITMEIFSTTNWQLCTMGLIELFAEDVVVEIICSMIENEVAARTTDNFGIPMLSLLFHWVSSILFDWIKKIMEEGFCCAIHDRRKLDTIMFQLKYCLYNAFSKIRIHQLYDMIIRFPYSDPAVNDLSVSLRSTEFNIELRELLQYSLKSKLLQHNMSTIDILYVYTSAIKVLRKIDPSGDLVQEVTQLIQGFLQRREKTAPCIISILVSKGPNEFLRSKTILDEEFDSMKSCVHSHCISRHNYHHCDIVALLIDICGSRELFAREYRTLLADRLLVIENINELFKEIKYLKLLQAKLGESLFNSCAMMLKDIDVSRCTNRYFYQEPLQSHCEYNIFNFNLKFAVKGIILSEHYWPRLEDDFIVNLPEIFLNHLEYYKKCYEAYKRNRTIIWNPNLGKVEMDIVINYKCLSVIVSPIQATVIWNFQNQEEWTIDDLSTTMNVPSITLMDFITFWIDKGVLGKKSDDTFILLKNLPRGTPYYVDDDDDLEIIPRGSRLYGDEIL